MNRKKQILIFIDWFYPGYKGGGPIQSCVNLVKALGRDYDISILTRDRDLGDSLPYPDVESNTWIDRDGYKVMYLSTANLNYQTIRKLILSHSTDHIYINGIFSLYFSIYPLMVNWFESSKIASSVTVAPRGMLLKSAVSKKKIKKNFFLFLSAPLFRRKNIRFHATNEKEARSVLTQFPGSRCYVVNNLGRQEQAPLVQLKKIPGEIVLAFIARIDPIKNLDLVLDLLPETSGRITLQIVGPKEDSTYWELCERKISRLPERIKVQYLGAMASEGLEQVLNKSHLFVLLTKGENFGHSIFEAFIGGRPALISDQTPWRNLEKEGIGFDISLSERDEFVRHLNQAIHWTQIEFDVIAEKCWNFASSYLKNDVNRQKYYQIFT